MSTYQRPPPSDQASRLLRLEDEVLTFRRRFRLALLGYAILALGLIAAFYFAAADLREIRDLEAGTVAALGAGQARDCEERAKLREGLADLGVSVEAEGVACEDIRRGYARLGRRVEDR
jgi:hypothetical protein